MPEPINFSELTAEAKEDPNVLGLFLVGSRGKGFHHKNSDYDAWMIVKEKMTPRYEKKYSDLKNIDLMVMSLNQFKKYAEWGSEQFWDRYDFAHTKILVNKNSKIEKYIKEKSCVPKKYKKQFIASSLEGYINGIFRSVKQIEKNDYHGARLEAANYISFLLDAIFALENRTKPFYGYLGKELNKYPLKKFPYSGKKFLNKLMKITATADLKTQQEIFKNIKNTFSKAGYSQIFKDWEGKDEWILRYK